jgi:hypothetical protein
MVFSLTYSLARNTIRARLKLTSPGYSIDTMIDDSAWHPDGLNPAGLVINRP